MMVLVLCLLCFCIICWLFLFFFVFSLCFLLFFFYFFFFFFFQAEDGIRDWSVTGVQTCALPISNYVADGRVVVPDLRVRTIAPATTIAIENANVCGSVQRTPWSPVLATVRDRKSVV